MNTEESTPPPQGETPDPAATPVPKKLTASKLIRRSHMYVALFLTPWMIVYGLSGLVLNHFPLVRALYGENLQKFEKVEEREYTTEFSADADARMIGAQILSDLGLSGSFNAQGNPQQPRVVINRGGALVAHRVTYFRNEHRLLVERQRLAMPSFVNRAHFRHGYDQPFLASKAWGVIVDLVIVSMLFWIASGIWMWWEIKPARLWGAAFGIGGLALFALLLVTL